MDHDQAPSRPVPITGERRLNGAGKDDHVGFALRLAYQRASANLTEAIADHGLTPMQFQTLLRLRQRGAMAQNELGRSVGMPPANIHATVRRLVTAGLVATESRPSDRRLTLVALTAAGERTLTDVLPIADAANRDTLSVLTARERATMMALLRRLAAG